MRLSKAAILTSKERLNSDEMLSQQILFQGGLLKRYGAGIYGKHNLIVRAQANIEAVIRNILDKHDCIEVSLPLLQPKSIWEASGRWEAYHSSGQMFYCDMPNGSFCMAPTAEEAVFEFVRDNLKSYKDLPVNVYQIGNKFRNELRARGGLLRSKEFTMMDAYSFHASEEDLEHGYSIMKKAYLEIFDTLGLKVIPVSALNGDMGGKISEEFMFLSESGEDTILVNENETMAFNTEILEMDNYSDYLKQYYGIDDISTFTERHCIELGHIFQLGQKYSTTMRGTFKSNTNEDIPFFMGCYGIGVSRTLAAICEQNCTNEGLIWPDNISPYQLTIIYTHQKREIAFELYDCLQSKGIKVIIDDRYSLRLGSKIKDWKLLGIPYMVVIGDKCSGEAFELETRRDGSKKLLAKNDLINYLGKSSSAYIGT